MVRAKSQSTTVGPSLAPPVGGEKWILVYTPCGAQVAFLLHCELKPVIYANLFAINDGTPRAPEGNSSFSYRQARTQLTPPSLNSLQHLLERFLSYNLHRWLSPERRLLRGKSSSGWSSSERIHVICFKQETEHQNLSKFYVSHRNSRTNLFLIKIIL